jgi:hypothetical protein
LLDTNIVIAILEGADVVVGNLGHGQEFTKGIRGKARACTLGIK